MTEHVVATVQQVPEGTQIIVTVRGREIGIFNVHGNYYALPNNCFHQNGPVCLGLVSGTVSASAATGWRKQWGREGEIVVCPWHNLEFDVTNGQCLAFPDKRLTVYPVKVEDDQIKVIL